MHVASVNPANSSLPATRGLPPGITYVDTDSELFQWFSQLGSENLLALDTEAASFHRYQDRVYLIQLSTRSRTALIDPIGVTDLSLVGRLLADPDIEIVFHDADYDLRLLDRDLGFRACRLFDTRIAAQLLREPGVGLAALLAKYFDLKVDKRFQRADWSARPLSNEMLAYAATDTHHLLALRDILKERLSSVGRLTWAEEEFRLLEQVRWTTREDAETGFLRIKGARTLPPQQLAVLRELYAWREATARKRDRAPFRILNNQVLLQLALSPPGSAAELGRVVGVGPETVRRNGKAILAALKRGLHTEEKDLPRVKRSSKPKPDPEFDRRLERLKATRNGVAQRLDLEPGVVCPNATLEAIATTEPATMEQLVAVPAVREWQAAEFGEELLAASCG